MTNTKEYQTLLQKWHELAPFECEKYLGEYKCDGEVLCLLNSEGEAVISPGNILYYTLQFANQRGINLILQTDDTEHNAFRVDSKIIIPHVGLVPDLVVLKVYLKILEARHLPTP